MHIQHVPWMCVFYPKIDRPTCRWMTVADNFEGNMESWYPDLHSHEIVERGVENRCTCAECYPYHSSSSSVHSGNTTKSSDLFGDTFPIPPSDALDPTPNHRNPHSGHSVHPSNSRQSTNLLFGQNGNLSSNVNAKGGWPSAKPFSEHSNPGHECNSSNRLIDQNRNSSLRHHNAKGFPGRCECTCACGTTGSPEEYTDQSSSSQFVSLTCLCPSSTGSDNTQKPIIYLTFSDKSKRHFREIKQLCDELRDCLNFSVKCDNYDVIRQSGELNILQWRDTNFSKALWILFCISPDYSNTLRCMGKRKFPSDVSENEKGILYIHSISRAEFLDNGSRNYRMIPLVFTKSDARVQDIPCFLKSSPFYKYPMEKENLFERLIQYG